ncbi:MAG: DoxX family protein [Candidatus Marinimicrobia bacterium]|jgi:putative oxidoreductase|nr:DoxX family protein [Candidatus Neomarinimicrobiota bacterium]|tara:strand:+ start:6708 stop:7151 length:444 start_codon:yes stop_codon:yes gene_type:complete
MSRIKLIVNNLYPKDLYVSYSLLILRVIASVMMIINHGWNKILAGQEKWNRLGTALTDFIGIDFMSVFFGFMAAFSESIGMVMVIFGIFTRPAAFLLLFTMFVASMNHLVDGKFPELAIMYLIVMLVLLISGPGKFSLDYKFFSQKN